MVGYHWWTGPPKWPPTFLRIFSTRTRRRGGVAPSGRVLPRFPRVSFRLVDAVGSWFDDVINHQGGGDVFCWCVCEATSVCCCCCCLFPSRSDPIFTESTTTTVSRFCRKNRADAPRGRAPPTPPRLGRRDPGPPPRVAIVARSADGRMSALAMHEYSFKNPVTTGVGNSVTAGKASLIEC